MERTHYLRQSGHPMPRFNTSTCLLALCLVFPAYRLSAGSACEETASDHAFLPDGSQVFIDCSTGDSSACPVDVSPHVQVSRVVGPGMNSTGTADSINPDSTLVNSSAYVSNGVVSANAHRSVQFDYVLWLSTDIVVSLNGNQIAAEHILGRKDAPGTDPNRGDGSSSRCCDVPVALVRFAARNLGGIPTPGDNVIELKSTIADPWDVCDDCSHRRYLRLSFLQGPGAGDHGAWLQRGAGVVRAAGDRSMCPARLELRATVRRREDVV